MKTKYIILMLVILISFAAVGFNAAAYYRDDYWECTSEGEASQGDAFGRRIGDICQSTCCKLCVSPNVYQDCLGSDAQPSCQCSNGNPNDFQPPVITVISPTETTYSGNDILVKVQTNEVTTIKRKVDSSSLTSMCTGCTSAQIQLNNMKEGMHTLYIEAKDNNNNKANQTINFAIDSISPVIKETRPLNASYVNNSWNEFSVTYDEETSLSSVKLYYKNAASPSYTQATLSGCENGLSKTCTALINLNAYPQGTAIKYYFTAMDAASTAASAVNTITVNNSMALLPFIINKPLDNSVFGTKNVPFDLSSTDVASFYYSTDNVKFLKLCSSCRTYVKNVTSIKDGIHDMIIRKIDAYGNINDRHVNIIKDVKNPKIREISPDDEESVNKGNFSVTYDEDYVKEIILHYGPTGMENTVLKTSCASGKKMKCIFDGIDLSMYNNQQIKYWLNVSDYARSIGSKVYSLDVDTTSPLLAVNNPVEGGSYDNSITFNLASSEMVNMELSDNGGKFSKLCGDCTIYSSKKSFALGGHSLAIRATDPAGNVQQAARNVIIY